MILAGIPPGGKADRISSFSGRALSDKQKRTFPKQHSGHLILSMNLKSHGNTDLGKMRRRNEDAFLDDPANQLYAVADGLGGLSAGDRASRLAIDILKAHQQEATQAGTELDFRQIFSDAHKAIQKLGSEADPARGAGTTLTVALVREGKILIAHAGDSAAYLFSTDGWEKLTTDHTEAEDFRKMRPGEKVPPIFEHTLTRCLGQPGALEPDLFSHAISPGDCLFLCTDGVTRGIEPEELSSLVKSEKEPKKLIDRVLELANERGGSDNATVVAIVIHP